LAKHFSHHINKLEGQKEDFKKFIQNKIMHIELSKDKRYYSIGEVAKAFDVNASLIRFWDSEFDILKPKKNAKGNRMFTPEDIKNLQLIYHLVKERGFTLEGAKIHLKEGQKKTMDKFEIISKLEAIRMQLVSIKNEL
jgi:DNA-binding transcriptional MerR regulator